MVEGYESGSPSVQASSDGSADGRVKVIVQAAPGKQADAGAGARNAGGEVQGSFASLVQVEMPISGLRDLAASEAELAKIRDRPVWGRWLWIGPYQLKRMVERYERQGKPELAAEINRIREELGDNNYSEINQWGAAARWTQLEIRKSQPEKEA